MSIEKEEERVIKSAHEFARKFKDEILGLSEKELMAYISSKLDYESWKLFVFYNYPMFALFVKTVKEDLESLKK